MKKKCIELLTLQSIERLNLPVRVNNAVDEGQFLCNERLRMSLQRAEKAMCLVPCNTTKLERMKGWA
jgi:hypothetical protein